MFFHARRRGRLLALDRHTAAELERELAFGPSWFVNFPALNRSADPSFAEALERRTRVAATGAGSEVRRVLPDARP